ncbi:hypothetical protein ACOSP7_028153 [Xanthoceras sorbifolium]
MHYVWLPEESLLINYNDVDGGDLFLFFSSCDGLYAYAKASLRRFYLFKKKKKKSFLPHENNKRVMLRFDVLLLLFGLPLPHKGLLLARKSVSELSKLFHFLLIFPNSYKIIVITNLRILGN